MTDQSALFWGGGQQTPRRPKPGIVLWTLTRDGLELRCELRYSEYGCEVQVLRDGELTSGKLHPGQEIAVIAAGRQRAAALEQGWTA